MSSTPDTLRRGLCAGGAARFLAVQAARLAELTRAHHHLDRDPGRTAAEGIVATLLMSAWVKGDERITLQIQAEHPPFSFIADADAEGGIRARLTPRHFLRHAEGHVSGMLLAIKAEPGRELYRGMTPLVDQRLDQALTGHLASSDQVDVVLAIDGASATGFMVERLPEHPAKPSLSPEAFLALLAPVRERPASASLAELEAGTVAGTPAEVLETRPITWRCSCGQERVEAVLASLGADDLRRMIDEDGGAEVTCHFCNVGYRVSAERLRSFIAAR